MPLIVNSCYDLWRGSERSVLQSGTIGLTLSAKANILLKQHVTVIAKQRGNARSTFTIVFTINMRQGRVPPAQQRS